MHLKFSIRWLLILPLLASLLVPASGALASRPAALSVQPSGVTAYDLIIAMNTLRVSYGLPALVEDPIIDAVAQSTAQTMAAAEMSWHIGNVSGRLASAGYGGGAKVWGTENFAVGNYNSVDQIMVVWSDPDHMLPADTPAYCNVGAGMAQAPNGMTYYILQAAYTSAKSCGEYRSVTGATLQPGGTTDENTVPGVPQVIVPVKIATPGADGKIYHVVEAGQSLWAIAVAYKTTIKDLQTWNNLAEGTKIQIGQRLFIPSSNTVGYATPTPVGMVLTSTPDPDGKVVHVVQAYQTLSTIAGAYGVTVDALLALNGLQIDWPLQIGQKLVVHPSAVTPSPTPRPLTPIEKLTPASDGKYYHVVQSGETLSWIADLYQVKVDDLMSWNGLNASSILQVGEKLLLQVTPPAPPTATPGPPTATPTATLTPTPTRTSPPRPSDTPAPAAAAPGGALWMLLVPVSLAVGGLFLVVFFRRKNRP